MNTYSSFFQYKYRVNGVSLANIIDSFIFGAPGPTVAIEECDGWECGQDCDYTRAGAGSPAVCGWWYWFTALRSMSPKCQNSLADFHVSGLFEWPLAEACPCINELDPAVVANHQCPHLFAYGYSPGIPAPQYPILFPNRPTQQPNNATGSPLLFSELGEQCKSWRPLGKCSA